MIEYVNEEAIKEGSKTSQGCGPGDCNPVWDD